MTLTQAILSVLPHESEECWKTSGEIAEDLRRVEIDPSDQSEVGYIHPRLDIMWFMGDVRRQPTSPSVLARTRSLYEYQRLV